MSVYTTTKKVFALVVFNFNPNCFKIIFNNGNIISHVMV